MKQKLPSGREHGVVPLDSETPPSMPRIYQEDLAYIQAAGFGDFARGAAPEIVAMLRSAAIPVRRIVEVGCGGGSLTSALDAAGLQVTGIDLSADLLKIARNVCPNASFILGSIYDHEIPDCDAIVAVGEPLTYHGDEDADSRVREFFRRAAHALPDGGLLIFDLIELGQPSLSQRARGNQGKTGPC